MKTAKPITKEQKMITQEKIDQTVELILSHIPTSDIWKRKHHITETAHGIILEVTINHSFKPDGPGTDRLEHVCFQSPRLKGEALQEILDTGLIRWIEGSSWQAGKALAIAIRSF